MEAQDSGFYQGSFEIAQGENLMYDDQGYFYGEDNSQPAATSYQGQDYSEQTQQPQSQAYSTAEYPSSYPSYTMNTTLQSGPQLTHSAQPQFGQSSYGSQNAYGDSSYTSYPTTGQDQKAMQTQSYSSSYPQQQVASSTQPLPNIEDPDEIYGASPHAQAPRHRVASRHTSRHASQQAGQSSRQSVDRRSEHSHVMAPPNA